MLVIDEAHYLFPQTDVRRALPNRINWLLTELVNFGVPVALISTPQFTTAQRVVEKNTHWASEQLIGRMARYTRLPDRLEEKDLEAVARYHLREGGQKSIAALVAYAQASRKYLAGIDHATKAARYQAQLNGRCEVTFEDIKMAIATNVMPSDNALQAALSATTGTQAFRLAEAQGTQISSQKKNLNLHSPGLKSDVKESRPVEARLSKTPLAPVAQSSGLRSAARYYQDPGI